MLRTLTIASVLVFTANIAASAQAADLYAARQENVSVADVNFDNPDAVAKLYQHIQYAARTVCDQGSSNLQERLVTNQCMAETISNTISAFGNSKLIAYEQGLAGYRSQSEKRSLASKAK